MKKVLLGGIAAMMLIWSCVKETDDDQPCGNPGQSDTSYVNLDLGSLPYPKLSDYNLFQGDLRDMNPQSDVLPYDILSHLFTDYAQKQRFIWMPDSVSAEYVADAEVLDYPTGTVLVKNFYYDNVQPTNERRIIETRLLIRMESEWMFADYVWNDSQDEAFHDLQGSFTDFTFMDHNNNMVDLNYRIPSETECHTCHNVANENIPIGPKPQALNMMIDYNTGSMNQLDKWEQAGMLSSNRPSNSSIVSVVDYTDETADLELRVRSYVDINCSHCHSDGAYCDYRPMRFAFDETHDPDNLGICITPDDQTLGVDQDKIVSSGAPEHSMMYYRISSTDESERMPLTGRTVVHEEAVQMIGEWITSLSPPCD